MKSHLVDMFSSGPGEAAGVVAAEHVKRRAVGVADVGREDHGHQRFLLSLDVVRGVLGHALSRVE